MLPCCCQMQSVKPSMVLYSIRTISRQTTTQLSVEDAELWIATVTQHALTSKRSLGSVVDLKADKHSMIWTRNELRSIGSHEAFDLNVLEVLWLRIENIIDYRCADGRFLMSPRGMAVSNTRYLSSSETRVNAGIRAWKLHLSESTSCQESVGGICFTNKWRAATLQPLKFSNHC
jgi:hypothetical protein